MNTQQRGVYQPLVENVPVYHLTEEDDDAGDRSRVPLLIVIALIVLAAFAGVVWLAYNQGVARGRASVAQINAPEGPVRTAPDDAGGAATPFTGLKIYGQPVPPDQEAQSSALAPQLNPNIAVANPEPPQPALESPPARLNPEPPPPAPRLTAAPAPAPVPPPTPTAPAQAQPAPAAAVAQTAPAAQKAAPAAPKGAGSAMLQIGAYESIAIANNAFAAFKAKFGAAAGEMSEDVQKVDLGAKGIWYRLRVGPYTDKTAAVSACIKLKAQGATCFLTAQ